MGYLTRQGCVLLGPPQTIFPRGLALHFPALRTPSPNGAVREPPRIAVVKAVLEGGLQVPRGCNGGRAEATGLLGLDKGQCIAILGCPVVEHDTWEGTSRIGGHFILKSLRTDLLLQNASHPSLV